MRNVSRGRRLTAGVGSLFLTVAVSATATICNWTNTSGGNWSNPLNWSPNQVPGSSDTAVITNPGTYTVSLDVSPTIAAMTLGAANAGSTQTLSTGTGSLTVAGPINISPQGQFNLTGGTTSGSTTLQGSMTMSGGDLAGVLTVATNSVLNLGTGGDGFKGLILTNYGTINWTNTILYAVNGHTLIYNYGTWNAQSDNIFYGGYGSGTSFFDNFGTFVKTGNSGTTTLDGNLIFNNSGTVLAESGTLSLAGGGTNSGSGTFGMTAGAFLDLNNMDFPDNATIGGNSIVQLSGNTSVNGILAATNAQLVNCALSGTNVVYGNLTMTGGNLSGIMTLASNSVLNLATGGDSFKGLILTNYGMITWTNTILYAVNGHTQIYNYGAWNAQSDNIFYGGYGGGTSFFENFGTFVKTGNSGTTTLDGNLIFNNSGTVLAESGTLSLGGGGTNSGSGTFGMDVGAFLDLNNMDFPDNAIIGGNSVVQLSGNTTVNGVLSATNAELVNCALSGTNVVYGNLTMSAGSLSGIMTLASNSVLNLAAGGDSFKGLILTNYGMITWTNTILYAVNGHTQIYNYGAWNAQSDNTFYGGYGGGTSIFDNFGTFVKTGNSGITMLDGNLIFNNTGTVLAQSGILTISGGGTNSGGGKIGTANAASLVLDNIDFANGASFGGNSVVQLGGNTTVNGVLTATNAELVNCSLSGTNVVYGNLTLSGSSLGGTMTLASNSVLNLTTGGDSFKGLILTNYGMINWTNTILYAINGDTQIYNYGAWNAQSDNIFYGGYGGGTSFFDNFGTFVKTGNSGTTTLDGNMIFNNSGIVLVTNGTLMLEGGGAIDSATLATASGGMINLSGFDLTNTNSFTGSGSFLAGNTTINGTIDGTLNWIGGTLSGWMLVPTNSVFNILGDPDLAGFALTNLGVVNCSNVTLYGISGQNAQIYNYGAWNAQGNNAFHGGINGNTSLFENYGTFVNFGGATSTVFDANVSFNSVGSLDLQGGTLTVQGSHFFAGPMNFEIGGPTNYGSLSVASQQNLTGIPVSINFVGGYNPAPGSQYQLVSSSRLSGQFTSLALPFGMSFNYSSQNATLIFGGVTEATWAAGVYDLHGTNTINFLLASGTTVELVAVLQGGASTVLGTTSGSGFTSLSFGTTQLSNSTYSLQAVVSNAAGPVGSYSRDVFVNNSLSWHEGILMTNQSWGTNAVNAVDQTVIIPNGVTLTIAPGTVIKFAPGAGIIIEAGGTLDASGATAAAPIIFTSLVDDSVGGDSDEDNALTLPEAGDWNGIGNLGQFKSGPFVQIRYVIQSVGGAIAKNQEWMGATEYVVNGNITIPTNVTLTIDPGAIIKFDPGLNITVEAGGTLIAKGNVAQPIIFTSINDQSVGAMTNGVPTTPLAGDWDSIYLKGGQAIFNHVTLSYGGGPDSLNSGLISLIAPGSVASVSDSILNQGLYKGIQAEYGTVNVTNCLVTGCDRGIQPGLSGPTTVNIVNCTIDNNNWGVVAHGGAVNIFNTIISDSFSYGLYVCCGSAVGIYEHNDLWSTNGANYTGVADQTGKNGNISANPQFVNAAQGNYELNYGSPCINGGDGAVAPLTDIIGAPGYNYPGIAMPTGTTNINGIYPDMGAYEFSANAPSDIDLIATAVIGPAQVTAGQSVTVQWNDVNTGSGVATGPWHDTVSLVAVTGGDPIAGTVLVAQDTILGPGQSYPASATIVVPPGVIGDYRWQVQVNSHGDVFEGANWSNNVALALGISSLTDPMVAIGGSAVTGQFTAAGQSSVFAVNSPGGTFVLNGQGTTQHCALQLFVGRGYVPDSSHFDFQSGQFDSPTASVSVPGTNDPIYYVTVVAVLLDASTVDFSLTATPLTFMLNSVSPSQVGNSGPVTFQVLGNDLTVTDTFVLTNPSASFTATRAQVTDPTVAYVTFNLTGAKPGTYNLQVTQPDPATLTLSNAVTIIGSSTVAGTPTFSVQLDLPPVFRKGRPINGQICYRNTGNVDMPAPLLFLSTGGSAGLTTAAKTNPVPTKGFLARSFDGPPGTLRPGGSGCIHFTARPIGGSMNFSITWLTVDFDLDIDWDPLKIPMEPPCDDTDWDTIWAQFLQEAGLTWGDLVAYADEQADSLQSDEDAQNDGESDAGINYGDSSDLDDILSFGFAAILGALDDLDDPCYDIPDGADDDLEKAAAAAEQQDHDSNPGEDAGTEDEEIGQVASGDPNAKFATGIGSSGWVAAQQPITYTIDFANETNASAPAQLVTVTDALSTNLDWSTLQLTSVSFNNTIVNFKSGVQSLLTNASVSTDPNPVSVTASLNPSNGVVTWVMESINPVTGALVTDPLAGFLPPDNASGQGEGSVTYTVMPIAGLSTGTRITNQAGIVFDVNAAIATPATTNTIDATPPSSSVTPLPSVSPSTFTVSWAGTDAGSGIAGFNIFISTNNGPWTPWLTGTTNTSIQFTNVKPNTYGFYSVAYDAVGNIQTNPAIPGATTTVTSVQAPTVSIARTSAQSLTLTWTAGVLEQATNLLGPWITNSAASPYVVSPTNQQVYFRLVQ